MKKLFIDDYIKDGFLSGQDIVNKDVKFTYNGLNDSINIFKYDEIASRIFFKYKNLVYDSPVGYFLNHRVLTTIFGNKNTPYLYKIGDTIGTYEILDYIRVKYEKAYFVRCNVDGYEKVILESGLSNTPSCDVCNNNVALKGINSIYDTDRWMCEYIANEEDWYSSVSNSRTVVKTTCPSCGREKYISLISLKNNGIGCNCGDGFSYPEKFTYSVLSQMKIQFTTEQTFNWSKNKKYDVYVECYNCIIEVNGGQHYVEANKGSKIRFRSLEYESSNDKLKRELALNNGIKHYVELDCRRSDIEWIKNSIMNSIIPQLFGFKKEDVDWIECHRRALNSRIKEACDLWTGGGFKTANELSIYMNVSRTTINNYLNKGHKAGLCHYIGKEEIVKNSKLVSKGKKPANTKIIEVYNDGVSIGIFMGSYDAANYLKNEFGVNAQPSHIISVCNGSRITHHGFTFKFIDNLTIEEYQAMCDLEKNGRLTL